MIRESIRREAVASFEHELRLWFYAGIFKQRWKNRNVGPHVGLATNGTKLAE
jgi:hypothetical protein